MTAEGFLTLVLGSVIGAEAGSIAIPDLDSRESARLIEVLSQAVQLTDTKIGECTENPRPVIGWRVHCLECVYQPVRWCGIAFSPYGAAALLQEHKSYAHAVLEHQYAV